ncbi:MAG: TetR family transcriptional regulator [Gammaproteobacteria bacterium]|nr:TetR family transcriptional regulator [Gammaproteobacteria bacterium]HBF07598.1 TetR/AcrR family transcriptional regulator [Gammaproteobacteria bacterium]|tara:strand:+ start:904 stop:1479 length:576 start_codon:yes stop_codon:yes gene_type:complete
MSTNALQSKQAVIEAASTMLALHGLRGISIREVTKFANAPLGSTYRNFPEGKQQIVAEAVTWAGQQAAQQLKLCLEQSAHNGIQLFLTQWHKRLESNDYKLGCPILAAAIEAPHEENAEQIKSAVSNVFKLWQDILKDYLIVQNYSKQVATHLSISIIAMVEGAVALCRGHQSIEPFDAIIQGIDTLLRVK